MSISEILSIFNILATVIVVIIGFLCNRNLTKMQKQAENSVYVAKIAFDMYIEMFDSISVSMFNIYNCICQGFCGYEDKRMSREQKYKEYTDLCEETKKWLNKFITSYSTRKYLLEEDMCLKLEKFESHARHLTVMLDSNIYKIHSSEWTEEDRKTWEKRQSEIEEIKILYNDIMVLCRDYVGQLQRVKG